MGHGTYYSCLQESKDGKALTHLGFRRRSCCIFSSKFDGLFEQDATVLG